MKLSSKVLSNLEDTLSVKMLAGPTRYGDIDRTYPAYEGEEDRSSNMVAQGVDVPSTQWRHVYPKTRRNASIIDTGVNDVTLSTMEIQDQLRGVLGLNHANQPRLASSVGQGKASSKVMNHERAFAVTKRSNRFNTQLAPPRPEGSDAGKAHFDQYMSPDAGLYMYRLRGKRFNKSNSFAGQRNGTSGLPKNSVKKPTKMRMKVKGKWTTVIKRHDKSLVNAKTGELLNPTFRSRNKVTDEMDKFVTYVQDILDRDDNTNNTVTPNEVNAETKKALKFAARVLVQAHQLARHPNRHQGFTVLQRDSYRALSKLALDIAKNTDTQGLEALLNFNSINNLGKKHQFDLRGSRRQNINDIRQHLRYERQRSHHHLTRDHRHAQPTMDSRHHDSRPTHFQHINHHRSNPIPCYVMPRRQEWHPNRFQHAMMTTVTPFNDGGDDTDGDLPPLSTPTPSIRHNDKGGETTTPILATTITQDHFSDSESLPQFTSVEHANYPEFPPNKRTEELEDERRQALKDLKEWDGIIMTPEMEWVQHYIELAHLEAQAQHYGNPYFQFNHLMDTISPMFTLKGEEFLKRHFDMKESNIQTIARHIYPTDVVLYSVQLQQAGTNKEHRPFYSTIHNKIDRIIASTKVAKQLTDPNTSEHDVDNMLDSARLLRCNTSYSTKSKQQNSRRHHKKNKRKRSSRRKTYHRDSDSNSSSDYSLSESSYSGEDSEHAYDSDGNKTTTMSFSSNHKRRSAQSKEIGKVLKRLYDGAKQYHLSEYSVTRGTVDKRKSYFRTWIDTLRQILCSEPRYSHLLAKYPVIDCSNISTTSNIALAQFMFAKIEASSRQQVRASVRDHLDGVAIIRYLQRNFGGTTIIDCTKALQWLKDTCWEHQDNIDTFSNKFLRRSETYRTTLQSSKTKSTLDDVELLTIYLENLTVTMPQSHPLHQNVQNKFVELESCIAAEIEPTFTVHQMIDQMRYLESIQLNNTTSTRTSYNRARSKQHPRTPHTKANVASESQRNTNRANLVTQSKKFRPVKCWGCGHSHNLRDCPTTTDDQKQAIYRQKREEKQQRSTGHPTNPNSHQANKAAASKQEESTTTATPPTTNISANKVIEMPRRRGTNFAAPAKHFSGMTTTITPERTLNVKAFLTLTCATIEELITLLNDWLLDSGCTAHMSNNRDDFIGELEPYVTMVEVANGSLIEVRWRGTVKLLLIDKFDPDNRATVYLKNVLYVPQLSRRLFSVSEWNQCGGQITFMPDRCRIEILDSDDIPIHTIDTDPIYAAEEINQERVLTVTQPEPARRKHSVEQHLLHQRLGHRAISTLLLAEEDDVWADVRMIPDQEKFCQTCKITTARKANRGSSPLEQLDELVPGMCVMVDIVKNPVSESITSNTYYPFYLTATDLASRFFVPIGMKRKTADNVFAALQEWATSYGPSAEFNLSMLSRIHGDYDSAFRSEELRAKAAQYFIKVSFAAPRHQEQNGIHEANWQHIRNLAFAMMNQARVPKKFFHFAFEHAWKVHAVLPHKALTRADGKVQTPLGVYEGKPVGIESFRVLFCPVVMTYDNINLRSKNAHGQNVITSYNRKNNPQRGIRGIHVGLPRHNTGYLVYVPQMNSVLHCNDVYFDENFESTLVYTPSRHPAHFDIVVTDAPPHDDDNVEQTGSPLWFCNKKSSPYGTPMQTFAKAIVHEDYDIDVHAPHDEFDDDASVKSHDDMPALIVRYEDDSDSDDEEEEFNQDLFTQNNNTQNTQQSSYPESINIHDQPTDAATSPQHRYPQRIRRGNPKYACHIEQYTQHHTVPTPEEFVETVERAYNNEVVQPIQEVTDMLPTMFLPAPDNWKQILKLPPHVMSHWSASLLKELKELIKKQTFVIDTPNSGDPIIPVTAKFRVKLTKDGMIEKLKSRIALRGDLMRDNVEIPDTWCPIAGFRAFKMFLAMAAHYKKRIYQLDYVAAFLQADVLGRKFTTLPIEWKEMFRSNPEVHQWLGKPLRLTKSLYGDRVANLAWDETQSKWLTSEEIGFERLPSERSIYIKRTKEGMMMVLNAVDDQLYFATTIELKDWFERETDRRFDVQKLGQAEWYLQSRITQLADYSIILDQSRYAALVAARYLGPVNEEQIPTSTRVKYASPLPSGTVFTKEDCSKTYVDVLKLQEEFGFEYAAAVGSLIYLMNTFIKLTFSIPKLAKFMQKPGRTHFTILKHLLHHVQCHRCSAGIKFYSDIKLSPLYQMMVETGNTEHADALIILFTDSSFQDCPDTAKSTGGYLTFMEGGVVDNSSHLTGLVCHSSCEAEYCHATSGLMGSAFIRKVYNEMLGHESDKPLTIPLGIDSQSAMDTANSHKETSRTRHIARRYHYVRFAQMNSETKLFKIDGTRNPADSMTKALTAEQLNEEAAIYQTEVDP